MAKQRLTDLGVKAAKAKGPRTDIWDSECAGLVLRVTSGGRKSWYLFYRHGGKKRRTVLGGANEGAMGLAEARKLARERRDVALGGDDPAAALKAGRPRTVAELIERYGNSAEARRKRTWPEERRILAKDVAPVIGKIELEKLRKADVLTVVERVAERGANRTADRTVRILSAILNWAVDDDLMAANPAQRIRRRAAVANPRERVLSASELRQLWQGLPAIYSDVQRQLMVKLILLTGCRKMEVQAARADELALAGEEPRWIIPGDRTKNRRTHTVPLSKMAAAVVTEALGIAGGSKLLFPAPSNGEVFDEGVLNTAAARSSACVVTPRCSAT